MLVKCRLSPIVKMEPGGLLGWEEAIKPQCLTVLLAIETTGQLRSRGEMEVTHTKNTKLSQNGYETRNPQPLNETRWVHRRGPNVSLREELILVGGTSPKEFGPHLAKMGLC